MSEHSSIQNPHSPIQNPQSLRGVGPYGPEAKIQNSLTPLCPLCRSALTRVVWTQLRVPVYQNRFSPDPVSAKEVPRADIVLRSCPQCDFLWNQAFDPEPLVYDAAYDNEQSLSPVFQGHLDQVLEILIRQGVSGTRALEIGCGQGAFLQKMEQAGVRVQGFDPAYSGTDPRVTRTYFTAGSGSIKADWVILRHVLEHVPDPLAFVQAIAAALGRKGKVYLEVPDFNWIVQRGAFWDVYYEHCNYFNAASLSALFSSVQDSGLLFGGQYCYLIADLDSVLYQAVAAQQRAVDLSSFAEDLAREQQRWQQRIVSLAPVFLWGAGAKGTTFCRLLDPERKHIAGLIDINPKKQGRYVPLSAHRVFSPVALKNKRARSVLIMNDNYRREIQEMCRPWGVEVHSLDLDS